MNRVIQKIYKTGFYLPGGSKRKELYLRKLGMSIGHNLRLYDAPSIVIDETRPWLIKIGDDVSITHGAVILTHDFSKTVVNNKYGELLGEGAETTIGNNCFIGNNAVILMGATIGNNVIVGAGSVVHGTIPDDVVVAGNPARVICTLEEYLHKRRKASPSEAVNVAKSYYLQFGKLPDRHEMRFFSSLFNGSYYGEAASDVKTWGSYEEFLAEVSADLEKEDKDQ